MQFSYCTAVKAGSGDVAQIHALLYLAISEVERLASKLPPVKFAYNDMLVPVPVRNVCRRYTRGVLKVKIQRS
jgi:hypothetical protein